MPFTHAITGKEKRPHHGAPSRCVPWDSGAPLRNMFRDGKWHDQVHTARKWQRKEQSADVSDATTDVLNHCASLVFHIRCPLHSTTCQIPALMPKSLWLVLAGSSPCQVNVSNQSSSPGRENQPIRTVSRCLTTRRQPERQSAVFPLAAGH